MQAKNLLVICRSHLSAAVIISLRWDIQHERCEAFSNLPLLLHTRCIYKTHPAQGPQCQFTWLYRCFTALTLCIHNPCKSWLRIVTTHWEIVMIVILGWNCISSAITSTFCICVSCVVIIRTNHPGLICVTLWVWCPCKMIISGHTGPIAVHLLTDVRRPSILLVI